ncbi:MULTISPECIES: hypothetical protein [unclassified Streptomyces]|uniref:hypothetical protein n=1 Tax=unclassified Streptomyces TaxID=2593676 RepID=UPI00225704E9|nr:hypothetical protein [Streptomyces sp. NBC_01306]MCX4729340.1 hypothetical protein [Streptomyces sp. NBC_01306]WSX65162.1 hypothetical protein OG221_00250 [Streptomyces sp. NBC_00932]
MSYVLFLGSRFHRTHLYRVGHRQPRWREPVDDELIGMEDDLQEAARRFACAVSLRAADYRTNGFS